MHIELNVVKWRYKEKTASEKSASICEVYIQAIRGELKLKHGNVSFLDKNVNDRKLSAY